MVSTPHPVGFVHKLQNQNGTVYIPHRKVNTTSMEKDITRELGKNKALFVTYYTGISYMYVFNVP